MSRDSREGLNITLSNGMGTTGLGRSGSLQRSGSMQRTSALAKQASMMRTAPGAGPSAMHSTTSAASGACAYVLELPVGRQGSCMPCSCVAKKTLWRSHRQGHGLPSPGPAACMCTGSSTPCPCSGGMALRAGRPTSARPGGGAAAGGAGGSVLDKSMLPGHNHVPLSQKLEATRAAFRAAQQGSRSVDMGGGGARPASASRGVRASDPGPPVRKDGERPRAYVCYVSVAHCSMLPRLGQDWQSDACMGSRGAHLPGFTCDTWKPGFTCDTWKFACRLHLMLFVWPFPPAAVWCAVRVQEPVHPHRPGEARVVQCHATLPFHALVQPPANTAATKQTLHAPLYAP